MGVVNVNGRTYHTPNGASVSVINNKVYINGKLYENCNESIEKNIKITIEGDINNINLDCGDITVHGNANNITNVNGDIKIKGDVSGDAKTTNGDISVKNIHGNAKSVNGNVSKRKWF